MKHIIERRSRRRDHLIRIARSYARALARRRRIEHAYLVGSVARGDFNLWSDIDIVVVMDELPQRMPDRLALFNDRPPEVEVIPFTAAEFDHQNRRGNDLVREAMTSGVRLA